MSERVSAQRNTGIDALRLVCMLMVVILHVFDHGGAIDRLPYGTGRYASAWLVQIAAYCAVNCYALISGYVGVKARFRYANVVSLWLQVAFYAVGITAVFAVLRPDQIGLSDIARSVTPVGSHFYWYYTSYFCISLFFPLMNHLLLTAPKALLAQGMTAAFAVFSFLPMFWQTDMMLLNWGFSPLWLAVMYMAGGYMRLYGGESRWGKWLSRHGLAVYGACTLASWAGKWFGDAGVNLILIDRILPNSFLIYNSPQMVLAALSLVMWFASHRPSERMGRAIVRLAPAAFGVYLIHNHPVLWANVTVFELWTRLPLNAVTLPAAALLLAGAIFAGCIAIDLMRIALFERLHIRALCRKLTARLDRGQY